ncbi:MAG TPA: ZIP family metal transporter [Candidatus Thermoplasmatota archaeon]|nr:ZIP family metal transporter [Candidatus Thermoplasmatota archaeon]
MTSHIIPAILSVIAISLVSFAGALALVLGRLRGHTVLIGLVAFAAGTLLGDAFFHLLPESVEHAGAFTPALALSVLGGFFAFFLLETALRWQHSHGEGAHPHEASAAPPTPAEIAPFAWTNLIGDGIHNFVDGILIGAAYLVSIPVGLATTIAVAAHEIPQEMGDFAVLLRAGLSKEKALMYNLASALTAVLGTVLVLLIPFVAGDAEAATETFVSFAVPIIAGGFIYIAAADLVPELHHHSERRFIPMIMTGMLVGLLVMAALLQLEASGQ